MRSRARSLLGASGAGFAAATLLLAPSAVRADVAPFVDCVVAPVPPSVAAKIYFGYANDGTQVSIPFGDANPVAPVLGYQGQPQVFATGVFPRVFHAVWNTAVFDDVSWELNGHVASATAASPVCVAGATGPVSDLTPTSATLTGMAGGGVTYAFAYGTGAEPDRSSSPAVAGAGRPRLVEWELTGLQPATLYRYRLVATDADGTTVGELRSFTTPSQPQQPVDLALTQALAPATVDVGSRLSATLTVANRDATAAATGVTVTDLLPPGASFDAAGSSPECAAAGPVVTCAVGTLPAGAQGVRTVAFTAAAPATLANVASVTAEQRDPDGANDLAVALAEVRSPAPQPPGGDPGGGPPGGAPPGGAPPGGAPPSGTPPGGTPPGGKPPRRAASPPVISRARLDARVFVVRRGGRGGTTLRFKLSRAARVRVRIESPRSGVRRDGACKPIRRTAQGRPCTRWTTTATFTVPGRAGANAVAFTGRAARRALPAGRHRVVLTPAGGGRAATVAFAIR